MYIIEIDQPQPKTQDRTIPEGTYAVLYTNERFPSFIIVEPKINSLKTILTENDIKSDEFKFNEDCFFSY